LRTEKPYEEEGDAVLTADTEAGNFMKANDGHRALGGWRRKGERGDDVNVTTTTAA